MSSLETYPCAWMRAEDKKKGGAAKVGKSFSKSNFRRATQVDTGLQASGARPANIHPQSLVDNFCTRRGNRQQPGLFGEDLLAEYARKRSVGWIAQLLGASYWFLWCPTAVPKEGLHDATRHSNAAHLCGKAALRVSACTAYLALSFSLTFPCRIWSFPTGEFTTPAIYGHLLFGCEKHMKLALNTSSDLPEIVL